MDPCQRLQQDHTKSDPLQRVQDAEPEPQTPSDEGAGDGAAGPGDVLADVGDAPEHLAPARSAEADGEDGKDPAVVFGEDAEEPEEGGPDEDEEEDDEADDLPGFGVVRTPEVAPVAAVGRAEPVVLDEDGDEEPEDDFAAGDGGVKGGDGAGGLAVVGGEAEEKDEADSPEKDGDGDGDGGHDPRVHDGISLWKAGRGGFGEDGAPVPEGNDVGLLCTLDDTGAIHPCFDGGAT